MNETLTPADELPAADRARLAGLPPSEQLVAVRADQSHRWRAGSFIRVEAYLVACPDIAASADDVLVLIAGELALRLERGDRLDPADYARRFPQFQAALPFLFAAQQAFHEPVGTREFPAIPGYELEGELGRGSMGVVYRARHLGLGRPVALKVLLSGGLAGSSAVARFNAEAKALARLRHPNIVQVYDVGAAQTPGGTTVPYIALELIDGPTLADFAKGRSVEAAVAAHLVEQLADALDAAHKAGVVHRDVKPANILLQLADLKLPIADQFEISNLQSAIPKLTDFGLAKLLDGSGEQTASGAILGTPAYMAPEQASERREQIGPATDVYALGAVLYELLTGLVPFRGSTMIEVVRQVKHDEPVSPKRLQPRLPVDLETVCLKCLEKEPSRRYASAAELAEDLRRFRVGEPVVAGPPSVRYRLRKFVRRNKGPVLAGAAIASALLLGVAGFAWQARIAQHERDTAQAERDAAQAERDRLKKVSDFQAQMLWQVDPNQAGQELSKDVSAKFGAALARAGVPESERANQVAAFTGQWKRVNATDAARALIDRTILKPTVAAIDKQFGDQPLIDATLRQVLADRYRHMGLYDAALPLQERALTIRRAVLGDEDPDTLISITSMASLLGAMGKHSAAEELIREALEQRRRALGEVAPATLITSNNLAVLYRTTGRVPEAIDIFEKIRAPMIEKLGPDHEETLTLLSNLGVAYKTIGRVPEAIPILKEVSEQSIRIFGMDDSRTLTIHNNLAAAYEAASRVTEAIPIYELVRDRQISTLGAGHPSTLNTLNNLAVAYQKNRQLRDAITTLEFVRDQQAQIFDARHPATLRTLNNLAQAYRADGRYPQAISLFKQIHDIQIETVGPTHSATLITLNNLAGAYQTSGRVPEAIPIYEQVRNLKLKNPGPDDLSTLTTMYNLARAYQVVDRPADAIKHFELAATGIEKKKFFPPDLAGRFVPRTVDFYEDQLQFENAERWRRKWLAVVKEKSGPESAAYTGELAGLGQNLLQQKKYTAAESVLEECLGIRENKEADDWRTFNSKSRLGAAIAGQKKYADAVPLLVAGYEGMKKRQDKIPPQLRTRRLTEALDSLIKLYDEWGKPDEAVTWRAELEAVKKPADTKPAGSAKP